MQIQSGRTVPLNICIGREEPNKTTAKKLDLFNIFPVRCLGTVDNSLAAERHKAHMEKTFPKAGQPVPL